MSQLSIQGVPTAQHQILLTTTTASPLERERLTLLQVYNCDETGLCYRLLPTHLDLNHAVPGMKKKRPDNANGLC